MANYPLIPGTLASNCYPADPQTLYNEMFSKGIAQLATGALIGVVVSATTPAAADRDKLWLKLNGSGQPSGTFYYASGLWLWPHPVPASSSVRQLWVGTTGALVTFDGGTNTAVTASSGPFWEVDTNFEGRSPMGPGSVPDTSDTLVVDTNYGEGKRVLTASNLPDADVTLTVPGDLKFAMHVGNSVQEAGGDSNPSYSFSGSPPTFVSSLSASLTSALSVNNEPFNVVHPVRGCYLIKRTARQFYVG